MTPESWVIAGLAALRQDGPGALRADTLAKRLGVSRGSFYWHFENVETFCKRVVTFWERAAIAEMGEEEGQAERELQWRLAHWARQLQGVDGGLERQVRAWAGQSRLVQVSVDRVDRRRVEAVCALFEEAGWERLAGRLRGRAFYLALAAQFSMGRRHGFSPAEMGRLIEVFVAPEGVAFPVASR